MRPRGQSAGGGRLALVPAAAAEDTEQRVAERLPEVFVEVGVDKRVQRRVEVTDPEEYLHDDIGTVARFAAERDWQVPNHRSPSNTTRVNNCYFYQNTWPLS